MGKNGSLQVWILRALENHIKVNLNRIHIKYHLGIAVFFEGLQVGYSLWVAIIFRASRAWSLFFT